MSPMIPLPALVSSAALARCPMSIPHESPIWTTADELAYLHMLHRDKKVRLLRVYVKWAHQRIWYGPGMRVEAGIVILEARDLLDDLVKRGEA